MSNLYDEDYWTWAQQQANALRRRSGNELDWDRLAEELDALSATEERELRSRYTVLMAHLLKWAYQPERRSRSWTNTIATQRDRISDHIARNPGLKGLEDGLFLKAYKDARRDASTETDLDLAMFPAEPPFTKEQAKDEAWLPDAAI